MTSIVPYHDELKVELVNRKRKEGKLTVLRKQ
jgi:hypothetical protein